MKEELGKRACKRLSVAADLAERAGNGLFHHLFKKCQKWRFRHTWEEMATWKRPCPNRIHTLGRTRRDGRCGLYAQSSRLSAMDLAQGGGLAAPQAASGEGGSIQFLVVKKRQLYARC